MDESNKIIFAEESATTIQLEIVPDEEEIGVVNPEQSKTSFDISPEGTPKGTTTHIASVSERDMFICSVTPHYSNNPSRGHTTECLKNKQKNPQTAVEPAPSIDYPEIPDESLFQINTQDLLQNWATHGDDGLHNEGTTGSNVAILEDLTTLYERTMTAEDNGNVPGELEIREQDLNVNTANPIPRDNENDEQN